MRAVNLLPAPRVEKRSEADAAQRSAKTTQGVAIAAGASLAVLAAVVGFAFVQGRSTVHHRQAKLDLLQAQVEHEQGAAAVSAKAVQQAQAAAQAHLTAITSAASGRTAWDSLLDQLARVMPRGAWLESLQTTPATTTTGTTSTDTSSTTTTPSSTSEGSAVVTSNGLSGLGGSASAAPVAATFTVTGYARSQAIVANVMERLSLIPALSDVSLTSSLRTPVGDKNAVQFTIGANVRSPGGNG
jgi:Tfp pilus assembly protein PilN